MFKIQKDKKEKREKKKRKSEGLEEKKYENRHEISFNAVNNNDSFDGSCICIGYQSFF